MKTYIKNTDHYIKNSKDFVDKCKNINVAEDETLVSYDVTALYPSVPQEEAIQVFNHELMNDNNLEQKTKMRPESVAKLFRTCVETTYFIFNGRLYKQIDGLAIGASTSGFAAELFMQRFEKKALSSFTDPPTIWKRYVDDTFAKLKTRHTQPFLNHLNQQHPQIKFTTELPENNTIAFLDTNVKIEEDRSVSFGIYRKKTHTDQYLDFNSRQTENRNHPHIQKQS